MNKIFQASLIGIPSKVIEFIGEARLGNINTGKQYFYKEASGKFKDSVRYEPSSYLRLWLISKHLKFTGEDVFIDVGCGAGRAVFFFATQRVKKAIGLDINRKLILKAKKNIKNFKGPKNKVEFWNGDALKFDLSLPTIFYFFNPFGEKTFRRVLENIHRSLIENPRQIKIIYNNPVCKKLVDKQKWLKHQGSIKFFGVYFWSN